MAISTQTFSYAFNTLTLQNLLISSIHSGIVAVGWSQTSDTGQVGTLGTAVSTALNTSAGYRVYVNSDASLYLKIEFVAGFTSPATSSVRLSCATGTNGAGTLTGNGSTKTIGLQFNTSVTTVTRFFGDGQDLAIAFQTGTASQRCGVFSIGCSRDANGVRNNQYFHILAEGDTSVTDTHSECVIYRASTGAEDPAGASLYIDPIVTIPVGQVNSGVPALGQKNMAGINGFSLSPFYPRVGTIGIPTGVILMGFKMDAGAGSALNLTVYGNTSRYINVGETFATAGYGQNTNVRAFWIKWQ